MSSKAEFHVTVKGIVLYQGKMLILKKVNPSKDAFGYWELPGGGMEYDETPVEAMKREALEETGLQIEVIQPVSTFHVTRKNKQIVGIVFVCEASDDNVQLSDEHTTYLFVNQEEAKMYLDPKIMNDTFNQGKYKF